MAAGALRASPEFKNIYIYICIFIQLCLLLSNVKGIWEAQGIELRFGTNEATQIFRLW